MVHRVTIRLERLNEQLTVFGTEKECWVLIFKRTADSVSLKKRLNTGTLFDKGWQSEVYCSEDLCSDHFRLPHKLYIEVLIVVLFVQSSEPRSCLLALNFPGS